MFSKDDCDLQMTHLVEHHVNTLELPLVKLSLRKIAHVFVDEDHKKIEKLKAWGVIQPSTSSWAEHIVMVQKKDERCVDYYRLNLMTRDDAFLIQQTQDCLEAVAGAILFLMIDTTAAFHQIQVPNAAFQRLLLSPAMGCMILKQCHLVWRQHLSPSKGSWS